MPFPYEVPFEEVLADLETDDVILDVNQLENCKSFIRCWQAKKGWNCLGGDKGKTVPARSIGTLDCLEETQ